MAAPPLNQLYRSYAAKELEYADRARLPNVQALHARAAAKWIEFAERAELVEPKKR